jgi:hypothetical protein
MSAGKIIGLVSAVKLVLFGVGGDQPWCLWKSTKADCNQGSLTTKAVLIGYRELVETTRAVSGRCLLVARARGLAKQPRGR